MNGDESSASRTATAGKRTNGRACISCHGRKVRCDILQRGSPCSNCQAQGKPECRIFEKKKTRTSQARQRRDHVRHSHSAIAPVTPAMSVSPRTAPSATAPTTPAHPPPDSHESIGERLRLRYRRRGGSVSRTSGSGGANSDDERSTGNLADFIDRDDVRDHEISKTGRLYFIGTEFSNMNYLVRQKTKRPILGALHFGSRPFARQTPTVAPEALELPAKALADELIAAYFTRVNRGFPIVDETEFYARYHGRDADIPDPSLLLMNAIFLVGAHVLPLDRDDIRALRPVFFRRTKLLFDSRYEEHREVYLQSALLISWYCENLEDVVSNMFYWVGVAVRTAIGMGMHRDATPSNLNTMDKRQWVRWWWMLFQFDVMTSTFNGRPQAIRLDESNVRPLQECHFEGISNSEPLFSMYLTRLCVIFSKAMRRRTAVDASAADAAEATRQADDELAQFITDLPDQLRLSLPEPDTWQATIHLTYNSFLVLLHRPSPGQDPRQSAPEAQNDLSICWDAVVETSAIFESLRARDALNHLWLPSIHMLLAAMAYVTGQLRSANPVVAAKAQRLFESLWLTLRAFARHWMYARSLLRLFDKGKMLAGGKGSSERSTGASDGPGEGAVVAPPPSPSAQQSNARHHRDETFAGPGFPGQTQGQGQAQAQLGPHLNPGYNGFGVTPPEGQDSGGNRGVAGMDPLGWAYGGSAADNGLGMDATGESFDMMPDPSTLDFLLAGMGQEYDFDF